MDSRPALRARFVDSVPGPNERTVWGMRPAVWVLLVWALLSVALLTLVLLSNNPSATHPWWRAFTWAGCLGVSVALLLLRGRTPDWFIQAALVMMVIIGTGSVTEATLVSGVLNWLLVAMILAAYVAYFLPKWQALAYVLANSAGLLVGLVISGNRLGFPPFAPWFIVTGLSVSQVLIVGTLVRDLKRNAVTDPLTGLLNRAGLEALGAAPRLRSELQPPRALVVIDLDGFKEINDKRGHRAGDRLLVEFADAMRDSTRAGEILARVGGDEFVAVLASTDESQAAAMVDRMLGRIEVGCSYGTTTWVDGEAVAHAIDRADEAMYRHKARRQQGRST